MSNLQLDDIALAKQNLTAAFEASRKETKKVAPKEEEEVYEPLLTENKNRFVLFPIKYNDVRLLPSPCKNSANSR